MIHRNRSLGRAHLRKRGVEGTTTQKTSYAYATHTAEFSFDSRNFATAQAYQKAMNTYFDLTQVTMPSDGWLSFGYEKKVKNLGRDGIMEYYRITNRQEAYLDATTGTNKTFNTATFTYSSDGPDGYPTYVDASDAPDSWRYWTKITDVRGTVETLTYDKRHLLLSSERVNESPTGTIVYKHVETTEYDDLNHKLPTKRTITKYTGSTQTKTLTYSYGYDSGNYGDLIAEIGPLGTVKLYEYDATFHLPVRQEIRQTTDGGVHTGKYLKSIYGLNGTGDVTRQEDWLKQNPGGATPVTYSASSPVLSGSSGSRQTIWRWVTPAVTNKIMATVHWCHPA